MIERFARLPSALRSQARSARLGDDVPALLAHPDWSTPAPVVIWMHGRTVNKELDPGRYLRWIRAGIAACALDLPGHGERFIEGMDSPGRTLYAVEQMIEEIDGVVASLKASEYEGVFDTSRMAIGGMSAGGMVTLRRLCDAHDFKCAAVESTAGDFKFMPYTDRYPAELISRLNPMEHLENWRPIPLLALHSETDEWVPVQVVYSLFGALRAHHESSGADPDLLQMKTWPSTGAPYEHAGFGRVAKEAKNLQLEFFKKWLDVHA